jgi:DNA-binding transcriptional regulator YiaG
MHYSEMTGGKLRELRQKLDLSIRELADRWGVGKSTLHREEDKDAVRQLYADAIRYLEQQAASGPTA